MDPDETKRVKLLRPLQALGPQHPLWQGVHWLVAELVLVEQGAGCQAGLSSGDAHRALGRLGMLLDLQGQLAEAERQAFAPEPSPK